MNDDERPEEVSMARLAAQYGAACRILHDAYVKRDDVLIPFVNTAAMAVELSLLSIAGAFGSGSPDPDGSKRLPGLPFDGLPVKVIDKLEFAFVWPSSRHIEAPLSVLLAIASWCSAGHGQPRY